MRVGRSLPLPIMHISAQILQSKVNQIANDYKMINDTNVGSKIRSSDVGDDEYI